MATAAAAVIDERALIEQMARNIRSLARQRGLHDQDIADLVGIKRPTFSSRMTGDTRWLATEIRAIAKALNVPTDVIYAANETEFRYALAAAESRATRSEKSQRRSDLRGLPRNTKPQRTKSLGSPLMTPV